MKAYEWIDRLKVEKKLPSDYAAAKMLGLSQPSVMKMRARADATLSDESAVKLAELLGVNPAAVILDQIAERSKIPEIRATFHKMAGELCILCKVSIATILVAIGALPQRTRAL